jgi:uncharacterized membrane protein YgcG
MNPDYDACFQVVPPTERPLKAMTASEVLSGSRPRAARCALCGLASAFMALLAWPALAAALTLPPAEPGRYVYDLAEAWQPAAIEKAQLEIANVRARTGTEIAVVSWPSGLSRVNLDTARADALTIMNTWGVGQKGIDDGLVILFDLDTTLQHGQIYLYGGRGFLASYLSQADLQAVVNDAMLPPAKNGDLDGALLAGLALVDRAVVPGGNPHRGQQDAANLAEVELLVTAAAVALGAFGLTWWWRGRDARIPLIDDSVLLPSPPPELTPALATVLANDGVDDQAFTAALVDLGHRGLLTFRQEDLSAKHPRVDLVVPPTPLDDASCVEARRRPLGEPEADLAASVASQSVSGLISSDRLRKGIGQKLKSVFKKDLGKAALASGWFRTDPRRIVGRWHVIGGAVAIAAGVIFVTSTLNTSNDSPNIILSGSLAGKEYVIAPVLLLLGAGVAIALLARFLPARTKDGAQILAMALAYRNTLRYEIARAPTMNEAVAGTRNRLPWITTPDELTVWGVAFGLDATIDALLKRSLASDATPSTGWVPVWYSGATASVGDFGGMLGSISTTGVSSSGGGFGGGGGGGGGGAGGGF